MWSFSPLDIRKGVKPLIEDLFVEKDDSVEGLILGSGGNMEIGCEMGQEGGNFNLPHIQGMAFFVEKDKFRIQ
jgi:hypothetical protein